MQWFIWEYVTVGVQYMPSVAWPQVGTLAWIGGDFRCFSPLANICPSGTSPPQSVRDSFAQPPKPWQEKAHHRPLVCIAAFLVLAEWGGTYSMNVFLPLALYSELNHTGDGSDVKYVSFFHFFFFSVCGKQWTCVTENEQFSLSTLSLYEVSEFGVSHEVWAVTVNQGLSPR